MAVYHSLAPILVAAGLALQPAQAKDLDWAIVERPAADRVVVRWSGGDAVDVYLARRPNARLAEARLVSDNDRDGRHELQLADATRPYLILKDESSGRIRYAAERLLPLERGSNFRDVGGYPAAGGKHVRWGMIYRTGAMPMLTNADHEYVNGLNIASIVDLRSIEERQLAPARLGNPAGARYFAHDYRASEIFNRLTKATPASSSTAIPEAAVTDMYRTWLTSLAPQYKVVFDDLLAKKGAVVYHCSAGQDRTGVATALVLSALGVPRDLILADYHLSTQYRRPENEMPKLDAAAYPNNPVAAYYRKAQMSPNGLKPQPLYDKSGAARLSATFDEIDTRWGSVENYLDKVLGVDASDIAALRSAYLQ